MALKEKETLRTGGAVAVAVGVEAEPPRRHHLNAAASASFSSWCQPGRAHSGGGGGIRGGAFWVRCTVLPFTSSSHDHSTSAG